MDELIIGTPVDIYVYQNYQESLEGEIQPVYRSYLMHISGETVYFIPAVKVYAHVLNSVLKILVPPEKQNEYYPYLYDYQQGVNNYIKRHRMIPGTRIINRMKYVIAPAKPLSDIAVQQKIEKCTQYCENVIIAYGFSAQH